MKPAALVWLALAAVVVIAGFMGGRALRGARPESLAFDLDAPGYQGLALPAGVSLSGFTGFSEVGGVDGRVVLSGRVTAVTAEALTLATEQGPVTVRLTGERSLRRISAATPAAVIAGSTVVIVHEPASDAAQAILLVLEP